VNFKVFVNHKIEIYEVAHLNLSMGETKKPKKAKKK